MKRSLTIIRNAFLAIVGCAVFAAVVLYAWSQHEVGRRYTTSAPSFALTTSDFEQGRHLATIYGCTHCHGERLQGSQLYNEPHIAKIDAPNLTLSRRLYSESELERVIRHGIKRDGTSTWIMPAQMFMHLDDAELAAIIAFVRNVPEQPQDMHEFTLRPLGRVGVVLGQFQPVAAQVASLANTPTPTTDSMQLGRHLVQTACTECHGNDLSGSALLHAPDLHIVAAYDDAAFDRLMRTGVKFTGGDRGMMSETARVRFAHFTDSELVAVRTYLRQFVAGG